MVQCCDDTQCHVIVSNYIAIYSQVVHITTICLQPCNEPVHVDYNLSTRLCLACNYSTVCSQPIHNLSTRLCLACKIVPWLLQGCCNLRSLFYMGILQSRQEGHTNEHDCDIVHCFYH